MSNITLTIPNDDHIALRAFGKALEEMALAHGAPLRVNPHVDVDVEKLREAMGNAEPTHIIPEVDTTAQQVESLGADGFTVAIGHALHGVKAEDAPAENFTEVTGFATTDSTGTPWDERIHSTSKALNADGSWRLRRKPKDMDEEEWYRHIADVKLELSGEEQYDQEELTRQMGELGVRYDPAHDKGDETIEPPVTPPGDDFHTDVDVVAEQTVAGISPLPVPQLGGSSSHSSQSTPYKLVGSGDDLSSGSGIPVPPPVVVAPPVPEFDDGVPFPPSGTVSPALERMADHTTRDFPRLMTFLTERHGKIDVATVNTLLAQDGVSSVQELNAHPDKIGPFVARVKAHLGE